MSRQYHITGEHMVYVQNQKLVELFNNPFENSNVVLTPTDFFELGLTQDSTNITLNFAHQDVYTDDYSPGAPAEILTGMFRDAIIDMTLVHYDDAVLETCLNLSIGATTFGASGRPGTPMGKWKGVLEDGCLFTTLYLQPAIRFEISVLGVRDQQELPWRFFFAYLTGSARYPIGTEKSLVQLQWRAVPYYKPTDPSSTTEISGRNAILFDREQVIPIINPI